MPVIVATSWIVTPLRSLALLAHMKKQALVPSVRNSSGAFRAAGVSRERTRGNCVACHSPRMFVRVNLLLKIQPLPWALERGVALLTSEMPVLALRWRLVEQQDASDARMLKELFQAVPPADNLALKTLKKGSRTLKSAQKTRASAATAAEKNKGKAWTRQEHERFLVALDVFPSGPWKAIADYVGTKDSRQTMTHAQKYRQKHERQVRGLRNKSKGKKKRRTAMPSVSQPAVLQFQTDAEYEQPELASSDVDAPPATAAADAAMAAVAEIRMTSPPPCVTLVKQLSDSPRSAEGGVETASNDPFAPAMITDSLFAMTIDASDAWLGTKTESGLMEIFAEFEPLGDAAWPQMWSTNSLEEIATAGAQFDFFSESNSQL
ncbi:hypothetical protein BBJ28_00023073 [Nothophytophthora sp. Chile5]|nr:hypothetical protein BBJ28_00023073 [Nothophytophthora sp. Chile5]